MKIIRTKPKNTKPTSTKSSRPTKLTATKPTRIKSSKPAKPTAARPISIKSSDPAKPTAAKPTGTRFNKPVTEKYTCLTVVEQNELLKFLLAQMPQKGRNYLKSLLGHGQISVDGEVTTLFNYPLLAGQKVLINWTKVFHEKQPLGLKILFEDEHIIVIEKPAGMLSIATDQEKEQTAYNILSAHIKKRDPKSRIFVVHRLDRETSGVMMFAKSEDMKKLFQNNWKEVVLERSYAVVVEGPVTKNQGILTSWLTENKALRMYSSRSPNDGQKAVTHYRVLGKNNSYSLLEAKLETGRKNQIRVHMQDLGHSVIGDIKYGGTKSPINRLGLHAQILAIKHPITNENMNFESPIPKQFLSLLNKEVNSAVPARHKELRPQQPK